MPREPRTMNFSRRDTAELIGKLVGYLSLECLRVAVLAQGGRTEEFKNTPVFAATEVPIHPDGRLYQTGEVFAAKVGQKTVSTARTLSREMIIGNLGKPLFLNFPKTPAHGEIHMTVNLPSPALFMEELLKERDFWLADFQGERHNINTLLRRQNYPKSISGEHYLAAYLMFANLFAVWVACRHDLPEANIPGFISGLKFEADSLRGGLPYKELPERIEDWIYGIRTNCIGADMERVAQGADALAKRRVANREATEIKAARAYDDQRMLFYLGLHGYRHPRARRDVDFTSESARDEFVLFIFRLDGTEEVLVAVDTLWTGRAAHLLVGPLAPIVEVCQKGLAAMRASPYLLNNRLIHYNEEIGGHDWWEHFRNTISQLRRMFFTGRGSEGLPVV